MKGDNLLLILPKCTNCGKPIAWKLIGVVTLTCPHCRHDTTVGDHSLLTAAATCTTMKQAKERATA